MISNVLMGILAGPVTTWLVCMSNVESVPRAGHVAIFETTFGQWPETMGAKFLECIKLSIDFCDGHEGSVEIDAQRLAIVVNSLAGMTGTNSAITTFGVDRVRRGFSFAAMAAYSHQPSS